MAQWTILLSTQLDEGRVLAPERYDPRRRLPAVEALPHVRLGTLVTEVRELVAPGRTELGRCRVADTSAARDGVLTPPAELLEAGSLQSARKRARRGDVLISRLRPYLRQIAWVDFEDEPPLLVSPEFFVLRGESTAFLTAFLLSASVQRALAAAQEGGHHPRVPIEAILQLPVPLRLVEQRDELSLRIQKAVATRRRADEALLAVRSVVERELRA